MRLLLDTHVLIWLLNDSAKISAEVYGLIEQAADRDHLFVSAISPWEIAMLVAKGRLRLSRDVGEWIESALGLPGIQLTPLSPVVAVAQHTSSVGDAPRPGGSHPSGHGSSPRRNSVKRRPAIAKLCGVGLLPMHGPGLEGIPFHLNALPRHRVAQGYGIDGGELRQPSQDRQLRA